MPSSRRPWVILTSESAAPAGPAAVSNKKGGHLAALFDLRDRG